MDIRRDVGVRAWQGTAKVSVVIADDNLIMMIMHRPVTRVPTLRKALNRIAITSESLLARETKPAKMP